MLIIDSIKQVFLPEMGDHNARWDLSNDTWEYNYGIIKNYASYRPIMQGFI